MDADDALEAFLASAESLVDVDVADTPADADAGTAEERSILRARARLACERARVLRPKVRALRSDCSRLAAENEYLQAYRAVLAPVEQAKGVIMFLFSTDADAADDSLRWLSGRTGTDLVDTARRVLRLANEGGDFSEIFGSPSS